MGFYEKAIDKLEAESKEKLSGSKEMAMKAAVLEALKDFCEQDEEFAQAVVQGGSFKDCMSTVAKGVGSSISDLEAYKKAVQFYFRGADVRFKMEIDVCPNRVKPEEHTVSVIDLTSFL